jgi:hypothetical protein
VDQLPGPLDGSLKWLWARGDKCWSRLSVQAVDRDRRVCKYGSESPFETGQGSESVRQRLYFPRIDMLTLPINCGRPGPNVVSDESPSQRKVSHITTRFVRLDMKRGPYFGVVYPVSHPTCRIKDSNPSDMSLNSSARTHGCSISFVL